jgi:hypothetical protein
LDRHRENKKINRLSLSIFNQKWNQISKLDISSVIDKYEANLIYLKFISKHNTQNVVTSKWEHMSDSYYIWYSFEYNNHLIRLEHNWETKYKYAVTVYDKNTEESLWMFFLDNFMSAWDIEKGIEKVLK